MISKFSALISYLREVSPGIEPGLRGYTFQPWVSKINFNIMPSSMLMSFGSSLRLDDLHWTRL
jgi:hypothetical protein